MNRNQHHQMTMETSKSRDRLGLESKSQSHGKTSRSLLESLLLLSVCVSLLACLALVLTSSSQLYEVYQSLPVSNQFMIVFAISLFTFGYAATVREFGTEWSEKWVARAAGVAALFFISAFAYRMTLTVERLQHQLTAERGAHRGYQIANNSSTQEISGQVAERVSGMPLHVHASNGSDFIFVDVDGWVHGGPVQRSGYRNDSMGRRLCSDGSETCSRTPTDVAIGSGSGSSTRSMPNRSP